MQNLNAASAAFKSNHQQKRRPNQRPSIHILPGQVAFRVVCHASAIGGVIGCNGAIVSKLRSETGTKIHCEAPVNGSEHWIVLIVGCGSVDKRIILNDSVDGYRENDEGERLDCAASAAQAALIRVLERMWTVLAEKDSDGSEEEAYCGLLADVSQIGAVLGKGGRNVEWMRRETGANIRILPPPSCGAKSDELIQITGGTLAVKKAVVAVSGCLQDFPPIDGYPLPRGKVVEKFRNGFSKDPHSEFFPHLSSVLPPMNGNNAIEMASIGHLSSKDAEGGSKTDAKATEQEVVFKMLCSSVAAGGIIGRKGAIIRALQNETGASIVIETRMTTSSDRVVTISAFENLESRYSPAQNALVLVFARSFEAEIEKGRLLGLSNGAMVNARLLVPLDFVNCLNGNRGIVLSEMMEVTGADIQILEGNQVSDFVSENEVVIQITGEYKNAQNALFQVTARLRDNLLPNEVLEEVRARNPYERTRESSNPGLLQSSGISHGSSQDIQMQKSVSGISGSLALPLSTQLQPSKIGLESSLDYLLPSQVLNEVGARSPNQELKDLSFLGFQQPSITFSDSGHENDLTREIYKLALSSSGGAPSSSNLRQRKKSVSLRNITVEIVLTDDALGAVYGKDGSHLNHLRQISGTKVEVHDPVEGEGVIVISGPPKPIQEAISLVQSIVSDQ